MRNLVTKPSNYSKKTVEEIVAFFVSIYYSEYHLGTSRDDYYCGITCDIENNMRRHNIKGYTACVECGSFEVSSKVEAKLGEKGFDIGNPSNPEGNGGTEDSTIVYMAFKERGFKK